MSPHQPTLMRRAAGAGRRLTKGPSVYHDNERGITTRTWLVSWRGAAGTGLCTIAQTSCPPPANNCGMFRIVISVRRGSACNIPGSWLHYPTLEQARAAAAAALRHERVTRIAIVRNEAPPVFVEWVDR